MRTTWRRSSRLSFCSATSNRRERTKRQKKCESLPCAKPTTSTRFIPVFQRKLDRLPMLPQQMHPRPQRPHSLVLARRTKPRRRHPPSTTSSWMRAPQAGARRRAEGVVPSVASGVHSRGSPPTQRGFCTSPDRPSNPLPLSARTCVSGVPSVEGTPQCHPSGQVSQSSTQSRRRDLARPRVEAAAPVPLLR